MLQKLPERVVAKEPNIPLSTNWVHKIQKNINRDFDTQENYLHSTSTEIQYISLQSHDVV